MQQVYAYFGISKFDCEAVLIELVKRGLDIVQFQIVKEDDENYSLYVIVRMYPESDWIERALDAKYATLG